MKPKNTLSEVKRVKTDMTCITNSKPIKVTRKDVDDLDRKIKADVEKNEINRRKGYESTKNWNR